MADIDHYEANGKTERRIQQCFQKPALGNRYIILMHESGKCGKTTTKPHCEEQAPMLIADIETVEQAIEHADKETTDYISRKRTPHRRHNGKGYNRLPESVAGNAAKETSHTNK